jgi:hypothetical protein
LKVASGVKVDAFDVLLIDLLAQTNSEANSQNLTHKLDVAKRERRSLVSLLVHCSVESTYLLMKEAGMDKRTKVRVPLNAPKRLR